MTGPRSLTVHPHRTRARRLLPFLTAIILGPMACTEQPTEPSAPAARVAALSTAAPTKVLLLSDADGPSTTALANSFTAAGFDVTVRPAPSYDWNGRVSGMDAVVHLNGYDLGPMSQSAQRSLRMFVEFGGGYVGAQWNGSDASGGLLSEMDDLVLLGYGGSQNGPEANCGELCRITYTTASGQAEHPVLAGVPSTFTFDADGHDAGARSDFETQPSTVLMQLSSGAPAVLAREFGTGKVVNFSFAPNHNRPDGDGRTLLDPNVQRLYVNAVRWAARPPAVDTDGDGVPDNADNCPNVANADQADLNENGYGDVCEPLDSDGDGIQDSQDNCPNLANPDQADENGNGIGNACEVLAEQTITFVRPADQIYGAPAFPLVASASSGLLVNFTGSGECTMTDGSLSVTEVGTCTVTAHQAGDSHYSPAADVTRTFNVLKAPATIVLASGSFTYDGTARTLPVATIPAGLSGVSVSYSRAGLPVTEPTNADTYQVTATLNNAHYTAPSAQSTLTIAPATPTISWNTPSPIAAGAPLGSSQLNATATGVGGANLSSTFTYTPAAGTVLSAGTHTLSVQFTNPNYTTTSKVVQLTVTGSVFTFTGFFRPVDNAPSRNQVNAGSTVPMKFSLDGNRGLGILQAGSPSSSDVACEDQSLASVRDRLAHLKPKPGTLHGKGGAASSSLIPSADVAANGLLQYDGAQYTYLWKTSSEWAGTCRSFVLTLTDGTQHAAFFSFGKELEQVKPATQPTATKAPKLKKEEKKKEEKSKKNQKHSR
jgi:hypothetical protein